jgi:lipopolysaccharide/colanic/teichoic acid biosynthesis glycosyltransferase
MTRDNSLRSKRRRRVALLIAKRAGDISCSTVALVILSPVLISVAIAVLLGSGWPIFYAATRVGRNFTTFQQYKFRTMVKDASSQLAGLQHLNVAAGMIKIPDDPRVTHVGRWLRRYSLDELPQLYNILRGDMSLVGPRPYAWDEVITEDPVDREILSVRPGLTGAWQVTSRSNASIARRREIDSKYVRDYSIGRDFGILLATVPAVLRGRGGEVQL